MISFVIFSVVIACVATFLVILLDKFGVTEYMQVHGNDFFSQLARCSFCLCWWVSVVITVVVIIATGDASIALSPFVSTIIARHLL